MYCSIYRLCISEENIIVGTQVITKDCVTQTKGPDALSKRVCHNEQRIQMC